MQLCITEMAVLRRNTKIPTSIETLSAVPSLFWTLNEFHSSSILTGYVSATSVPSEAIKPPPFPEPTLDASTLLGHMAIVQVVMARLQLKAVVFAPTSVS